MFAGINNCLPILGIAPFKPADTNLTLNIWGYIKEGEPVNLRFDYLFIIKSNLRFL